MGSNGNGTETAMESSVNPEQEQINNKGWIQKITMVSQLVTKADLGAKQ